MTNTGNHTGGYKGRHRRPESQSWLHRLWHGPQAQPEPTENDDDEREEHA